MLGVLLSKHKKPNTLTALLFVSLFLLVGGVLLLINYY